MIAIRKNIIEGSKICVMGGAGFLGSHLVDHLIQDRNCEVLVLDNLIVGQKKFINPKAKFQWFDIYRDSEEALRHVLQKHEIEYVFNYVAEPYIPVSFERPLYVFNVNAVAAMKVINASQEAGVKKILQVSSAEIYGKVDGLIKEDAHVVPHSTYGVSKVAVDGFVQVRAREAKTPAIAMRQFNCYGPRETHPYIIPEIIDQLAKQVNYENGERNEKAVVKLGNNSTRDFQYAGDAVRMAVELLEKGEVGEVYNMGSGQVIKMYDLAILIGKLMGFKEVIVEEDQAKIRPWEIWHLQSDNTKLFGVIESRPETPFEEGLKKTIQDFYDNGSKWDWQ